MKTPALFPGPMISSARHRGTILAMPNARAALLMALSVLGCSSALADSPDCPNLRLSRTADAPITALNGMWITVRDPNSMFSSHSGSPSSYQCGQTTISDGNGTVRIVGKTFADAVKRANLMQPALYLARGGPGQVAQLKVVFGTDRVTVNASNYPVSTETIGFTFDQGATIKPLLLEGQVYPPMRFSATTAPVVFTDGEHAVWGEAWIDPKHKTITFRP